MNLPWFRIYTEARTDAKLRCLTDAQFRTWFALLCYAADQPERGTIAGFPLYVVAVETAQGDRETLVTTCNTLQSLHIVTCNMEDENAIEIVFINFEKRQHPNHSDSPEAVRDRVARHRANKASGKSKKKGGNGNGNVTPGNGVKRTETPRLDEIRLEESAASGGASDFADPDIPNQCRRDEVVYPATPGITNDPAAVAAVTKRAEDLWGLGSPAASACSAYPVRWVDAAITRAFERGKRVRTWGYIAPILEEFQETGGPPANEKPGLRVVPSARPAPTLPDARDVMAATLAKKSIPMPKEMREQYGIA